MIIVIINMLGWETMSRSARVWWNILAAAITVFSGVLFNADVLNESIDAGPVPFIILIGFGIISIIVVAGRAQDAKGRKR